MFVIGFCPDCGKQSQVRDVKGRPISGIPGSKLCYLTLADDEGVKTRIGNFCLCPDCDGDPVSIKKALIEGRAGISGNEQEFKNLPILGLEVVKVY